MNAGAVNVIYGPLGFAGNQIWTQNTIGVLDVAEANDLFGMALTVGDLWSKQATRSAVPWPPATSTATAAMTWLWAFPTKTSAPSPTPAPSTSFMVRWLGHRSQQPVLE
ncbi:MAG: hypothetical protein IPK16_30980 [Anaerolineales bacterium]|nr:hypothetical protein [Anaerolineales bacterium]